MIEIEDREVQYPNRVQLVPVPGTTDKFDIIPIPGTITKVGTPLNKETLDTIIKNAYTGLDKYIPVTASNNVLNVIVDGFIEQVGERIMLDVNGVASNNIVYLSINGGSSKKTNLTTNGKYELVYNGSSWDVRNVARIIIEQSGVIDLEIGKTYLAIVVGAGGGGVNRGTSTKVYGGGGAVNWGLIIPTTIKNNVIVGGGGQSKYVSNSTTSARTGENGGYSEINNIIAYGGAGATSTYSSGSTHGNGGTFQDGIYSEEVCQASQIFHYGGKGEEGKGGASYLDIDGITTYGTGGRGSTSSTTYYGENGVVILYPIS